MSCSHQKQTRTVLFSHTTLAGHVLFYPSTKRTLKAYLWYLPNNLIFGLNGYLITWTLFLVYALLKHMSQACVYFHFLYVYICIGCDYNFTLPSSYQEIETSPNKITNYHLCPIKNILTHILRRPIECNANLYFCTFFPKLSLLSNNEKHLYPKHTFQ